jgi:tetratricopeptide (TPR) repeat protein
MLGDIHWHLGEWTRARDLVEQAVALFHTIDTAWLSAYPLLQLGRLCVSEGRWEEAARHLEESRSIARRSQDLQALRHGQAFQAELDLLEGRPGAALSRMQPLLDRPGQQEEDVTLYLWLVAWAQLELGDSAETIAEESVSRATRQHLRIALAPALRIQGMALSRQCRWDEAERVFDRAIALSTDMAHPYAEANALYEAGLMYARKEEPERARAPLERALAIFRRLGAQPYVERAERVLAQLGGP